MNSLRSELMALYARLLNGKPVDAGDAVTVLTAADRIESLESLCSDKDASIAQLIEQLEKAEAQNAAVVSYDCGPDCPRRHPHATNRTLGETK